MKTFIAICKDIGGVYWRFKKNRRIQVYETMSKDYLVNFYRDHALKK